MNKWICIVQLFANLQHPVESQGLDIKYKEIFMNYSSILN